jgi:hypothetical protein
MFGVRFLKKPPALITGFGIFIRSLVTASQFLIAHAGKAMHQVYRIKSGPISTGYGAESGQLIAKARCDTMNTVESDCFSHTMLRFRRLGRFKLIKKGCGARRFWSLALVNIDASTARWRWRWSTIERVEEVRWASHHCAPRTSR